jgi:hypothetical protein
MKVGKKCPGGAHASSPRRGGKADREMDLRDWDADRAVRLSRVHFLQVERRLRPRDQLASRVTLESVFSQYATHPRRKK